MARQAEAERERRAKVIAAEGEFQASERLKDAAKVLSENPMSLQLRYLQTMLEMSSERTSTLILPLPIDLLGPLLSRGRARGIRARTQRAELTDEPRVPELRRDPLSGRWVALAPWRALTRPARSRTRDRTGARRRSSTRCPFCEGREEQTPPETFALGSAGPRAGYARLDGARRAEPVPGVRAPRGRRPHPAPRALARRAHRGGGGERSQRSGGRARELGAARPASRTYRWS